MLGKYYMMGRNMCWRNGRRFLDRRVLGKAGEMIRRGLGKRYLKVEIISSRIFSSNQKCD